MAPPPRVLPEDSENENRLVLLLIRCVPAELKQNVLEKGDQTEPMRANCTPGRGVGDVATGWRSRDAIFTSLR